MSLYIGIDGGGSKTKCVLCDEELNILYETQSGPSNFLTIGTQKVSETILNLVKKCCENQNISFSQISKIVLGTTGAGRESDANKLAHSFNDLITASNLSLKAISVVSDARIALEGAFSGLSGSILIAGTGSIMFGKDNKGNIYRVGGFGRLIGDEGSGLIIGRMGLNILAKCYDGRIPYNKLKDKIEKQFNITNQEQLISKVYSEEFDIQKIAPLVINTAEEGDELCLEIIDKQTDELILHILAMFNKLKEDKMKIVFIGGTIDNENRYSNLLKEKIQLYLPQIIIQKADYPPEIGAVIMAKGNY